MPRRLGEILRWVPLVGGTAGFFLALRFARERAALPAALAVLGGLAFVAIGIAGLSLLGRYLFLPAAMLCIFFGFAALGWIGRPLDGPWRTWVGGAAVLLVAFAGSTVSHQTDRLDGLRDGIQLRGEIQDDLRDLTRVDAAEAAFERCKPVYVPNHRAVPILAWYLDRAPADFRSAQLEAPRRGLYVAPQTDVVDGEVHPRPARPEAVRRPAPAGRLQARGRQRLVGAVRARVLARRDTNGSCTRLRERAPRRVSRDQAPARRFRGAWRRPLKAASFRI